MNSINNFLLGGSAIILFSIAIYTLLHRKVPGAIPLFIQMVAAFLWMMGSYLEINSIGLEDKVLWRNIQQIGVFIVPISSVFFAIDYSKQRRLRKYAYIIAVIPITALILIFTNRFHYLMRFKYEIIENSLLKESLVVHSTTLGIIFITINFFIPLIAVMILIDFRKKVSKYFKNQVFLVILSIVLTPLLNWIKGVWLDKSGIYIPVAVLYIPSAIILFHCLCLLKYNIFSLTPIARDKVFDVISQGILVVDESGNIIDKNSYASAICRKYFNISKKIIGMKISDIFSNNLEIQKLLTNDKEGSVEVKIHNEYGSSYLLCNIHLLSIGSSETIGQVIILSDITEKKHYELDLLTRAEKDGLTQLLNRQGFNVAYDKMLNNVIETEKSISCLMLDIDYFKKINDTFGHINGDKVLQNLADILRTTLSEEDIVGRIGGEEFVVILRGVEKDEAFLVAERIRKEVENSRVFIIEDKTINYTVSIGIADNSDYEVIQEKLLHKADIALYQAKESSRNCTIIYNK